MTAGLLVEPAHLSLPDWDFTFGPDVGELCEAVGYGPDPEQQLGLDAAFAMKDGRSAAFEVAMLTCRQNIKTGFQKQVALGWLFYLNERLVVWSAHEFGTAQEAARDLEELISGSDLLRRQVKAIYHGTHPFIELTSGARLIFKTRTAGGGRGLSGRKVILDEGFALRARHMGALLPVLSAQPDPQVIYGSSAGLPESDVLQDLVRRGRAGDDPRLAYMEWCAPPPEEACDRGEQCDHARSTPGCGCDKPEFWVSGNPTVGRTRANGTGVTLEYIADERRSLPPDEFGRERMGWHDAPIEVGGEPAIDLLEWAGTEQRATGTVAAFGLDVSADRVFVSVGMTARCGDGRLLVEHVERRRGLAGLLERCVELDRAHGPVPWGVDANAALRDFIEEMRAAHLDVVPAAASDLAVAAGGLVDDVHDRVVVHGPQPELDDAVKAAKRRNLGDGSFTFGRRASTADISPLYALTLARWAAVIGPDYDVLNSIF